MGKCENFRFAALLEPVAETPPARGYQISPFWSQPLVASGGAACCSVFSPRRVVHMTAQTFPFDSVLKSSTAVSLLTITQ